MLVPKFREFITEQDLSRKNKPITVAIITKSNPNVKKQKAGETPKKELTIGLIEKACKKKGFECVIINTKHAIITGKDEDKNTLTIYNYDGKDSEHTFIGKIPFVLHEQVLLKTKQDYHYYQRFKIHHHLC